MVATHPWKSTAEWATCWELTVKSSPKRMHPDESICTFEINTLYGKMIRSFHNSTNMIPHFVDFDSVPATTKEECCAACNKFMHCDIGVLFENVCYLKRRAELFGVENQGITTCLLNRFVRKALCTFKPGVDHNGPVIGSVSDVSKEGCCRACQSTRNCDLAVHVNRPIPGCYLKMQDDPPQSLPGATACVRPVATKVKAWLSNGNGEISWLYSKHIRTNVANDALCIL